MDNEESKYKEADYIQVAEEGASFGLFHGFRYRIVNRHGWATHHTNSLEDAKRWFEKCKAFWIECDKREGRS